MQKKGKYTAAEAMKSGLIPAAPIARVLNRWHAENWEMDFESCLNGETDSGAFARLAEFLGFHQDTLLKIASGKKDWVEFDTADRVIGYIDRDLWNSDPELSEIYEKFDFSYLDLARPPSPKADPLLEVEGLTNRTAAFLLGVRRSTLQRTRSEKRPLRGESLAA